LKRLLSLTIVALVSLPLALILTFLLFPFWNWFETITGIESMGHSGPANWCFVATFGVVLTLGSGAWFKTRRKNS
jgi:hypothetical protein